MVDSFKHPLSHSSMPLQRRAMTSVEASMHMRWGIDVKFYVSIIKPIDSTIETLKPIPIFIFFMIICILLITPIKNIWKMAKDNVQNESLLRNQDELVETLHCVWEEVSLEIIDVLIASMPLRMVAVTDAIGGNTRW